MGMYKFFFFLMFHQNFFQDVIFSFFLILSVLIFFLGRLLSKWGLEEVHPKRPRLTLLIFVTGHSHLVNLCIHDYLRTIYSLVLEEVHPKRSRLTLLIFVTAHSHLVNLCIHDYLRTIPM